VQNLLNLPLSGIQIRKRSDCLDMKMWPFVSMGRFLIVWLAFLAGAPAQSTAEWISQGDAYDAQHQTKAALRAYLEAEKSGTPSSALLHRIAKQYGLSMNDEPGDAGQKAAGEKALSYAQRSVAAGPREADAHVALAICYGRMVRFQETKVQIQYSRLIKQSAETALQLDPKNELGWYVLGAWHYGMAGLNPVKRALARVIYGALPSASYAEAAACFQRAITLNPSRMASYVDLGLTYLELDNETAAREMLIKGLALPDRDRDDPLVRVRGKQAMAKL
jgi:tetratricopeptide (TPR) repeat protein